MNKGKNTCLEKSRKEISVPFKITPISLYDELYVYGDEFPVKPRDKVKVKQDKEVKPFKNIDEMILKLEENEITLNDGEKKLARDVLKYISYHRVVVYSRYIESENRSFSKVLSLYKFDAELSMLIYSMIPTIENSIKRNYAYSIAEKIEQEGIINDDIPSALFYNNLNIYKPSRKEGAREILSNFAEFLNSKVGKDPMIDHHVENYGGKIPVWVLIEFLTLGNMHRLSTLITREYRKAWNNSLFKNSNDKWLPEWINTITILRNMCAHNARLYARNSVYNPEIIDEERDQIISTLNDDVDSDQYLDKFKHTIFSGLIIMKYFYKNLPSFEKDRWNIFVRNLGILIENYAVDINYLGFTKNWKDVLFINQAVE